VALKIHRFNLWFHYQMPGRELVINYVPIARGAGAKNMKWPTTALNSGLRMTSFLSTSKIS
jgi:hypothetical protein